ncbi:hypothetical protein KV100_05995 [Mumia sp. zg.B21]|uniref:hypothetical protein n=1 Tax=Mumia sp. zg.B21 TaxID=2855447 RepID=UPI001C6E2CDA|nr:hypothetical protein [Mumia sp. zg.B21]MBW9209201.1 hypothetical protein [Mumia sp. zg.B21]
MSRRGDRRLPRALRKKRSPVEVAASALLSSGLGLIVVVMLPIGWRRAYDGAVLLAGVTLLVAWAIVDVVSASRRPDEPRWSFGVRPVGLALSHAGLIVMLAATGMMFVWPDPPFWLWVVRTVGGVVFVICESVELWDRRAERARERLRERERLAYEQRRWEEARVVAEAAAESARTQAALIALDGYRSREAARVDEATPRRTGEGAPDRRP